jgi:hypothetical protein
MPNGSTQDASVFLPENCLSGMFYGHGWFRGDDQVDAVEPATGARLGAIALATMQTRWPVPQKRRASPSVNGLR